MKKEPKMIYSETAECEVPCGFTYQGEHYTWIEDETAYYNDAEEYIDCDEIPDNAILDTEDIVFIPSTRNSYNVNDVLGRAVTVKELREILNKFPDDAKVVTVDFGSHIGFTAYGPVGKWSIHR